MTSLTGVLVLNLVVLEFRSEPGRAQIPHPPGAVLTASDVVQILKRVTPKTARVCKHLSYHLPIIVETCNTQDCPGM